MIIESLVTTLDAQGQINCAPMGVEWGEEHIVIKPYQDTTTYRNLVVTRAAVVNLTDNVWLFAQSAISHPVFPTRPALAVRGAVLQDVCSWREVVVEEIDAQQERARITTRVVHRGFSREFLGFNRARHAVLEAAILATRTRFFPTEHILNEFKRLQVLVDKTGGAQEHKAMALLTEYVRKELGAV
ncbi:MAG: DUF447 family protein [Ardenticatenia bacterium]|nr:DUF447 family protein [Ardenticatenia bacterium]